MKIKAFYSDPHYGHKNIIEYCDRPFEDVEEMQREMIKLYNDKIGPNDLVVWCGDCFMGLESMKRAAEVMAQLNGAKVLVRGNHDKAIQSMDAIGFLLQADVMFKVIAEKRCRIYHYPPKQADPYHLDAEGKDRYHLVRPPAVKGEIIIHGHTHQKHKRRNNLVHVGVDSWGYGPALYEEVEDLIRSGS